MALNWLKKAADLGYASAQRDVADAYLHGIGTASDHFQAVVWYHKAAENGNDDAMHQLCRCYYTGTGTGQDFNKAFYWANEAVNRGNLFAKTLLGTFYIFGEGTSVNEEKGYALIQEVADQNENMKAKEGALEFLQEEEELREELREVISGLLVTHWSCSYGRNKITVTYDKGWGTTGLYVNAQLQEKKTRLSPFAFKVSGKLPDGESVEATIKGTLSFDCEVRVNNKLIYTSK